MYDVIVIGAGPSGLMASVKASENNKVLLIEKNNELGKKLKASGNGRCNVTNLKSDMDFIKSVQSSNPKFILSSLADFGPWDIYSYFFENNCPLKEEDDNRVFPESDNSEDILNVLVNKLNDVQINLNERLLSVKKEDYFIVETDKGIYRSRNVIMSVGGRSYPALGTTGDGYKILEDFNLDVVKQYPALTSLNSNHSLIKDNSLLGITTDAVVSFNKESYKGNILFTHFGLSGPAIFKISESVVKYLENNKEAIINIDLLPLYSKEELFEEAISNSNNSISFIFKDKVINRIIKVLLKEYDNKKIASLSHKTINEIIDMFKEMKISIYDSKGYKSAFVTSGGLSLKEVNPKTMEVKKIEGLYVTGELLDVHAYTGGYNITIALSTGYKAGSNIKGV